MMEAVSVGKGPEDWLNIHKPHLPISVKLTFKCWV